MAEPLSSVRRVASIGFSEPAARERLDPRERAIFTEPDGVRCHLAFDFNAPPLAARLELAERSLPTDREPLIGFDQVLDEIGVSVCQRIV